MIAVAAAVTLAQAYEYIFPVGHGWKSGDGVGIETIPVHFALVNQHAIGDPFAPFVAGGIDRLSFFGSADSALILSTWLFAFFSPPTATKICCTWLKQRLGVGEALLTQSCTSALEMAALLCNLAPGDEVIMPSFTFVSTANAVVLRGATPGFVEIRRDTLNINEGAVESAITPRTTPIFLVPYSCVPSET